MRPEYEKISDIPQQSFVVKTVKREQRLLLTQAWHYHPEIEICYTEKSNGRRFVGNTVLNYQKDDLVMFGSNLPHGFTTENYCSQVVIQLKDTFMGLDFINKPELYPIKNLFNRAKQGIEFEAKTKKKAIAIINQMRNKKGIQQFIGLLKLLCVLAETDECHNICSASFAFNLDASLLGRMKILYEHIIENFSKDLNIKKVADKLNLSKSGFYKFINKHIHKTYSEIINEFRINYASKLLITSDFSVTQICYECGFNNISYFNRKFKQIFKQTPIAFRKKYLENNLYC